MMFFHVVAVLVNDWEKFFASTTGAGVGSVDVDVDVGVVGLSFASAA